MKTLCWVVDGLREQGLTIHVAGHIGDAYHNFMDATIETDVIIRAIRYFKNIVLYFFYFFLIQYTLFQCNLTV